MPADNTSPITDDRLEDVRAALEKGAVMRTSEEREMFNGTQK